MSRCVSLCIMFVAVVVTKPSATMVDSDIGTAMWRDTFTPTRANTKPGKKSGPTWAHYNDQELSGIITGDELLLEMARGRISWEDLQEMLRYFDESDRKRKKYYDDLKKQQELK